MESARTLDFRRAPSALAFMARAILRPRRPGLQADPPLLGARWSGHRVEGAPLEYFLAVTGLADHPTWPLVYPHVVSFRLQMAVLTDGAFPLPIWNALQTRNRLVLHRLFDRGAVLDFETRVAEQRIVAKGAEIDLHTTARAKEGLLWESANTFYYRGRFGAAEEGAPFAAPPLVESADAVRWTMPMGGGIRCARLTGDYNGIHLSDWYARRFGFRGAFQHPQRVIGECLARLPRPMAALPLQLDVWLKGPAYCGSVVALRCIDTRDAVNFALHVDGDERPAIIGRLYG